MSVETDLISDTWRGLGDINESDRRHPLSEMWLYLRDAVREVGQDLYDYSPTDITDSSDYTISPVPSTIQKILIIKKMIELIRHDEWGYGGYNGLGVNIRGGLDTIDSSRAAIEDENRYKAAQQNYQDALDRYRLANISGVAEDPYSTTITNNQSIN